MYVRTKKLNCCYAYFTWPSQENCVLHSSDLVPFFKFEPEPIKLNLTLCGRLLRWLVVSVQGRAWRELAGMPRGCRGDAMGVPWGCHGVPPRGHRGRGRPAPRPRPLLLAALGHGFRTWNVFPRGFSRCERHGVPPRLVLFSFLYISPAAFWGWLDRFYGVSSIRRESPCPRWAGWPCRRRLSLWEESHPRAAKSDAISQLRVNVSVVGVSDVI